jgi:hypothetical protein
MAPGEQADEDALDHGLLADDDLADFRGQVVDESGLLLDHFIDDTDVHAISSGIGGFPKAYNYSEPRDISRKQRTGSPVPEARN